MTELTSLPATVPGSIPLATAQAQAKASDPRSSAWVSANAGAGKTFVLTRRVLRLLLDGQDPASLLCLTFTKAAAAEMAGRVFKELARWTRLDDAALKAVLADLGGTTGTRDLAKARGLFARALETPGGLKIQTIHAFCESLLHQFPFEAGVAASFKVLDDRDASTLMQEARAQVIQDAASGRDAALAQAFDGLMGRMADSSLNDTLDAMMRARHALIRAFDQAGKEGFEARFAHMLDLHAAMLGLADADVDAARATLADPMASSPHLPRDYVECLAGAVPELTATDARNLKDALAAHQTPSIQERRAAWESLLFKDGAPRGLGKHFPRIRKAVPDLLDRLAAEQVRAMNLQAHLDFADLMRVCLAVLDRFEALKARRGALDFDDLIARTASLLTRSQAQAWVRYKLDQRIDHVLVDEAQDTSAQQWAIIRALSDDFFDGLAAREGTVPTFFAVGDDKQSIYSFQGADPRQFDGTRRALETKAVRAGIPFEARVQLLLSFRSTRDILSAVDTVFRRSQALQGVTQEGSIDHQPHRLDRGQVEIWPVIKGSKADEPKDWLAPVDTQRAPHLRLAQAIGHRVHQMVEAGLRAPGDILILLRTRGAMADAINRELKKRAIAVAGTDRLLLSEHMAVEDLMALMQVVLLPEDDLALATLLTSPLVGLSDDQLENLAAGRSGLLIDALNAQTRDPAIHQAAATVRHWRAMADHASPFTFLATVLGRDGGRRKMLARLGEDCRDPLDEVLRLARNEEARPGAGLASLEAFLDTLRRIKLDIKRDMESRADKVRIMTVHGAKGLEAKTVFLVDTCALPKAPNGIVTLAADLDQGANSAAPPLLLIKGDTHAPAYKAVQNQQHARQLEEYRRLLYVAMTRARDQLIITGHMSQEKDPPDGCWYDLIDKALSENARDVGDLDGLPFGAPMRLWRADPWPQPEDMKREKGAPPASLVEDIAALLAVATPAPEPIAPLRPSRARSDALVFGEAWQRQVQAQRHAITVQGMAQAEPPNAMLFGTLVHRLLEPATLPSLAEAQRIANAIAAGIDRAQIEAAHHQAAAVHGMDEAGILFGPTARAEVPIRGSVNDAQGAVRPVSGSIDRLVLTDAQVWAIDFKTNADVPSSGQLGDSVPDYCVQMALYGALLARIFPDKVVCCGLLWTAQARLDWIGPDELASALRDLGIAKA